MKESLFLILAPFFPEQLKLRGINDHYFAPLFTSYSVFFFLTCLSAGRFILPNLGRSKTLRIGLILHVLACICFVLIFYTNEHQTELMQQYKDQENMIVGYLTFSGVFGNMLGMIFSSFLSFFIGVKGPFACFGIIFLIFSIFLNQLIHFVQFEDHSHEIFNIQVTNIYQQPFIIHSYAVKRYSSSSMIDDNEVIQQQNSQQVQGNNNSDTQTKADVKKKQAKKYQDLTYREVLKNRRAVFAFLSIALSLSLWTFIDTTLTEKLQQDFQLKPYLVCLFYSLQCAGFLITSTQVHKIIKRAHPIKIIIVAFLFQSLGVFLMGPSEKLSLPNLMIFTAIGLVIAGFSSPFISVPSYPEMQHALLNSDDGKRYDPDQLSDILSGLFNSAYSFGTILGPITASYITIATSFRNCCDIIAVTTLVFSFLYLVVVYIPHRLKVQKIHKLQSEQQSLQQNLIGQQQEINIELSRK
eukprot:403345538